jgi:hypothetical protein
MKGIYISILVLGAFLGKAQTELYSKLNSFVSNNTKEKTAHRLIAVNVWSVNDKDSRDKNVQFEEAYKVYANAKLKGGNKGIIVLNFNIDKDAVMSDITLKKDGISKTIKVPSDYSSIAEALKDKASGYNAVFDENGNLIYENLDKDSVFSSVLKLITR